MKNKHLNLIFLVIGSIILAALLWEFGFENLVTNIRITGWWLVPILAIWLVIYIMNTLAWRVIIGNTSRVNFVKLLSLKITGFSINYVTPVVGLAGEPWKILNIRQLIGIEKASSSVILYNMIHFLSHFYFWVTALLLILFSTKLDTMSLLLFGFVLLLLLSVIGLFYLWHSRGIVHSFIRLIDKLPVLKKIAEKTKYHEESLNKIENQIVELYQHRRKAFYYSLIVEYSARIIGSLEFFFIMRAINADISFLQSVYISAASSLLANLFFFVPLQLGTREGSLYLVYQGLKFTPSLGIYVSFVTRIREFFWILIGLILLRINLIGKNAHES